MENREEPRVITGKAVEAVSEFEAVMSLYQAAASQVETALWNMSGFYTLKGLRNPIDSIQSRIKSPKSILGKMARLGKPFTLENMESELNDIAGVRVICHFLTDVYLIRDFFMKQDGIEVVEVKDYIKNPKPSGYRSLHLITVVSLSLADGVRKVPVEIQIRTIAMNFWASCEHQLRYKKGFDLNEDQVAKLKLCADTMSEMDRLIQGLADELVPEEK